MSDVSPSDLHVVVVSKGQPMSLLARAAARFARETGTALTIISECPDCDPIDHCPAHADRALQSTTDRLASYAAPFAATSGYRRQRRRRGWHSRPSRRGAAAQAALISEVF